MVLTARVCEVGFHAGVRCVGIAMWGWPTYPSGVEGFELRGDGATFDEAWCSMEMADLAYDTDLVLA